MAILSGEAEGQGHGCPGDRCKRLQRPHHGWYLESKGVALGGHSPGVAVRNEVVAVDCLNHTDERIGVGHTGRACKADSRAAVAQLISPQKFGGAKEDNAGVCSEAGSMR